MQLNVKPQNFNNFVGQNKLKKILKIIINSAIKRKTMPDHMLLFGQSGSGKTTLANIIAKKLNANIKIAQGPLLQKKSDFLTFFATIKEGDVIFLDEFHGINRSLEELFYSVLEDFSIDVILGVDGDSRVLRMKIPKFTLIAATTKLNMISKPIFDRFGFTYQLEPYTFKDIEKIIIKNLKKNNLEIKQEDAEYLSFYSDNNPRITLNNLKRVIDFSIMKNNNVINKKIITKTLHALGIHKLGLNSQHLNYLRVFLNNKTQKVFSVNSIANILSDSRKNVLEQIEPLLVKHNFISVSSRGRKITSYGMEYLKKSY